MSIKFQEKVKIINPSEVHVLQVFDGKPNYSMPEIIASGRKPLDFKGFMTRRLGDTSDAQTLRDNYFTTSSPVFVDPAGSGEVVIASYKNNETARNLVNSLNPDSNIKNYSLVVSKDVYESIKEQESMIIPGNVAEALRNDIYSKKKTRAEFWEFQAEGDKKLNEDYGSMVDKMTDKSFSKNRGLWLPNTEGMRFFWLESVGGNDSDAGGINDFIDNLGGRLVGVSDGVASTEGVNTQNKGLVNTIITGIPEVNIRGVLSEILATEYTNTLIERMNTYKQK